MRVLIVDNNIMASFWGSPELRHMCHIADPGHPVTIETRRGPHADLPKSVHKYDKIIVSGSMSSCLDQSEWSLDIERLLKNALNEGKSILGVCYGHQLLARALDGISAVRKSATPEFGWVQVKRVFENPLLTGLPKEFYSFAAHYEEVQTLPKGTVKFAESSRCAIQGYWVKDKPVFGIQFHPERSLEVAEMTLDEERGVAPKDALIHSTKGKKLFDPKVGETIFTNFLKL